VRKATREQTADRPFQGAAAVNSLSGALPVVRHHHERYDGNGYPDGLAGEAIPLAARIVSDCDAYDAMTSDRPYRRRIDPRVAQAELRRQVGCDLGSEGSGRLPGS